VFGTKHLGFGANEGTEGGAKDDRVRKFFRWALLGGRRSPDSGWGSLKHCPKFVGSQNNCILLVRLFVIVYGTLTTLVNGAHGDTTLRRALAGDPGAFAAIVHENQSMIFSLAYHFLRDTGLAEEIAQDVFLKLYRDLATIQSASHLQAWLRRSTLNRCIDQSRSRAYRSETHLDALTEPKGLDPTTDPIAGKLLRRQVAALPETQRAVVLLRYQEGLEPNEIADTLCLPLNTVKSRLQRALQILRARLERMQRQPV
jgi:RNA polymerase sigma-70 factor, ECF subfamily